MRNGFCNRVILVIVLVLCTFSCSSDLDFNQAEDFTAQPVFTTNLSYFEVKAPDFIIDGTEQPFFSYVANVDFLNTSFVEEDLVRTELYFRIKNTIARAYDYNVNFLDDNNTPIYTITMNVPAYGGKEVLVEKTETFTAANVDILKRTTKMVFSIAMFPGPPLTANSPGRVELSSSITAYFDVK
ncbi:hypothetical protein DOS84_13485 [Flavobacterium aquariorum]|uniref:DUF4843 domain-containing protein n=1 Tax=Flavobacterium aquariorum TaxID=2217670 RepID=A0A2W7TS45_9FLAO|nr:hypothetical protein [Flavobacterium aquariorum]PZX92878.1 hypothetical protein DOS84_13485 [Flavobacterium aquariorum]